MAKADNKQQLRRIAYDVRNAQLDKERLSRVAIDRFLHLPAYLAANTAMWYVHCRSELRTRAALQSAINSRKKIAIPFCTVDESGDKQLGIWHLDAVNELVAGSWNILEPPPERWKEPHKTIDPKDLDIIMVPGIAFDRQGTRLGNGQGYYDRLLSQVRPNCTRVGICFECQLRDDLVVESHDETVHLIVTESNVYSWR